MPAHLAILPFPFLLNFFYFFSMKKVCCAHGCVGKVPLWRIMFNFVQFKRLPSL